MSKKSSNQSCSCSSSPLTAQELNKQKDEEDLKENLKMIKNKIVVMSGKGGVGKSTVAVNLAVSLAEEGNRVGLLDVDIHGPSVPKLLNLEGQRLSGTEENKFIPIAYNKKLKVISIGFLMEGNAEPVIWRGPLKYSVIQQFLKDVDWGELDYLIVDSPPGTGDEPLSVCQLIENPTGAVIVTTPQDVALIDVMKSITFCKTVNMPVIGVVENMSGFTCPHCSERIDIFKAGGGSEMSQDMNVPFLGNIPLNSAITHGGDAGSPIISGTAPDEVKNAFSSIVNNIKSYSINENNIETSLKQSKSKKDGKQMKLAIPTVEGKLCMHFGHCDKFAMIDVNEATKEILAQEYITPPPHEPGLLPGWLAERGAQCIIAGGMGGRAQDLFSQNNIRVITGAQGEGVNDIVMDFLNDKLSIGPNTCDH